MKLLKRIFGWNTGQADLIWGDKDKAPAPEIAPQFTSQSPEEDDLVEAVEEEIVEEVIEPKTEVKLGRQTYILEELTGKDIKKLQEDWGKGKLRAVGIIK